MSTTNTSTIKPKSNTLEKCDKLEQQLESLVSTNSQYLTSIQQTCEALLSQVNELRKEVVKSSQTESISPADTGDDQKQSKSTEFENGRCMPCDNGNNNNNTTTSTNGTVNGNHATSEMEEYLLLDRLLNIMIDDIIPETRIGVNNGNKVFGGAVMLKEDNKTPFGKDYLPVITVGVNNETVSPLWHGEMSTIEKFYKDKLNLKYNTKKECLFLSTHQPCTMCVSAITWAGFNEFYYFFDYADTCKQFNIKHDSNIIDQLFNCDDYEHHNKYFNSYSIYGEIEKKINNKELKDKLLKKCQDISEIYDQLSHTYQNSKADNHIPLK